MNSLAAFTRFAKIIVLTVFLVILAGGVVRMTQSGMGCPDWPKCFGRWIPPTNEAQLPSNYKELYAFKYVDLSFNAYHTWIEYINRLLGAVLGVLLFIQLLWSLKFRKIRPALLWLCLALVLITGFQGWLGSKVVEANLEVVKVTTHMIVALLIAALSVTVVFICNRSATLYRNKILKIVSSITIVAGLMQVVLGTQVREQVDHVSASLNFEQRDKWISRLGNVFDTHRSFSILVAGLCIYLFVKYKHVPGMAAGARLILFMVFANIALGIIMSYFNIPAIAQPLHLLFSSVLITTLYYQWLKTG
ncbi:MAG: COX15/CtaA family protein [Ginsengibacter sp.]